jgi:uncharacterized protein YuzE
VRLTYDQPHEIGYLSLTDERVKVARTLIVEHPDARSELHLDFDTDGHLLGIEFMYPSKQLRASTLAQAEPRR